MKFDDLPDKETLRLIKQLSENSSALNASRFLIDRRDSAIDRIAARAVDEYRRDSAIDRIAARAVDEFQKNQVWYPHKHILDLYSGAGSALGHFRSKAEQAAIDAVMGLHSSALNRAVKDAYETFAFQQRHVFRDPAIGAIRQLWRLDNPAFQALRTEAFAGTLMNYVREYAQVSDEAIEELQEIVDEKVKSLPQGRISADGILNLIVTVVLFLAGIAYQEMRNGNKPPSPALTDTQVERIVKAIEKTKTLIPENDDATYYVVERVVTVRVKLNNRSAPIATLYPNQKVRLEKRKHEWIYVEYFDYIEGIPKMGWVNKKYLKMLD
jgi:hypothetical protein